MERQKYIDCKTGMAKGMLERKHGDVAGKLFRDMLNGLLFQSFAMRVKAHRDVFSRRAAP
jgi:hypothetical protein